MTSTFQSANQVLDYIFSKENLRRLYDFNITTLDNDIYLILNTGAEGELIDHNSTLNQNANVGLNSNLKTDIEYDHKYYINANNTNLHNGFDIWYIANIIFENWKKKLNTIYPKQKFLIALDLKKYESDFEATMLFYAIRDNVIPLLDGIKNTYFEINDEYTNSCNPKKIEIINA